MSNFVQKEKGAHNMPFSFNFGGFNTGDFSGFGGFQDEGAAPPPKKPRKPRKALGTTFTLSLIHI